MITAPTLPTSTVDAATWESYVRHVRIKFMLAGTPAFDQYMGMRAAGVAPMLLNDLYAYDHKIPVARFTSMVKIYGTDVRFIQLVRKTMLNVHAGPGGLDGLWSWSATNNAVSMSEPAKLMDLYGFTFDLVKNLSALYRQTDMRKRNVYQAAVQTGEEYGRFALNLIEVRQVAQLAAQHLPERRHFDHTRQELNTFIRRLHKTCSYRGVA